MRRLRDVTARFQPLMNRIDGNLMGIQNELGLPPTPITNGAAAPKLLGTSPGLMAIQESPSVKLSGNPTLYLTNDASTNHQRFPEPIICIQLFVLCKIQMK